MKQSLIALILVSFIFQSCTKTLYTSKQVAQSFHTKKDVIARYGLPTEKKTEGNITEWLYDMGSVSTGVSRSAGTVNTTVNTTSSGATGSAYGGGTTYTKFNNYRSYIKFIFDERDNVMNVVWQGVDLSVRKKAPGRTVGLIVGSLAAAAALSIGILALSDDL
ncbi:MAG TPA: hypothetical protein PK987_04260 [Ferruginibacter sp.]|nr:hypothetical protein [Ferruginibacter sp.]